jgi:preprotein translocase subunit YajC
MMSYLLVPFTFSPDPTIAQLQACLTAVPITAVFWFAYHMFMVVLMDQKKQKQAKAVK